MSGECDQCGEHAQHCECQEWMNAPMGVRPVVDDKDEGHHCKKGSFTCFRLIGDLELTLDAPNNIQIPVIACPFCGKGK